MHESAPRNVGDQDLTTILVCKDPVQLALAQGILDDAGIPYILNSRSWGPVSNVRAAYVTAFGLDAPFTVQVATERAAGASELVAHLR